MLKELVGLTAVASKVYALSTEEGGPDEFKLSGDLDSEIRAAIDDAKDAIGRHDDGKRKTDEAICLLFRAVAALTAVCDDEGWPSSTAKEHVARAERLLGFAALEPATVD